MRELLVSRNKKPAYNNIFQEYQRNADGKSISEIVASNKKCISVELCPNRGLDQYLLLDVCQDFCTVTWLGSNVNNFKSGIDELPAISLAKELRRQGHEVVLHLAGRNLNKVDALRILERVKVIGIRSLLLLQGDRSLAANSNDNSDFLYARDLVTFVRDHYGNYFSIGVAGYPEKHPQSPSTCSDIKYLKQKVASGADFIITQASFDYKAFKAFSQICNQHGIVVPIFAGIFIISSYSTFKSIVRFCEIKVPEQVKNILDTHKNNEETIKNYGTYLATTLMKKILNDSDFSGVHVFTLNNLKILKPVLKSLGVYEMEIERPLSR